LTQQREVVSLREYSRRKGVTLRAVQKRIESGSIRKTPEGKIDVSECDQRWDIKKAGRVNKAPLIHEKDSKTKKKVENKPLIDIPILDVSAVKPSEESGKQAEAEDYWTHRARREEFEAKLSELKYLKEHGELLPLDECITKWQRALGNLYQKIRSLPTKLAPILKNCETEAEIRATLSRSIDDGLRELSEFKLADE
jgi:hypothetical protein